MPIFKYKAMDEKGRLHQGRINGINLFEIEQRLLDQNYDLINCKEVNESKVRIGRKRKLDRGELINMVFQLQQLTKAGVPLIEGIQDLRDSSPPGHYKDVLSSINESIEGGKTFSKALQEHPHDFDRVFISLISVGEESGTLPKVLNDMGNTLRWADEIIAQTKKIMIYPIVLAIVITTVTVVLMVAVVPQVIPVLIEMGGTLPPQTVALIATSDFIKNYWPVIIATPIISLSTIKFLASKKYSVRLWLDKVKLKLPLFGNLMFKIKIARLASYIALLYGSGITIIRALEIGKEIVDNNAISEVLDDVKNNIIDGSSISLAFEQADLFPPLVVRMVKIGENTGNLEDSLLNVSYFYNREVKETIASIEPTIGPILTIFMAILLGWILLSIFGPVWDTVASVGS